MMDPDQLAMARAQWRWRGTGRPPFADPPGPGQVSVWDFPRPPELVRDPRDIVVRDNKIGKNGWNPQFSGGPMIAKMMGGALPPIVWDGVTTFAGLPDVVNVRINDGPVLNLNLPGPGQVEQAKPSVAKTIGGKPVAEPSAVVLPKRQADLSA